jgi:2C-methyl-D-erythritol 2,4-cyclodiphosphate synthase
MRRQKILLKGVNQALNQFEYHKINVRRKLSLDKQNINSMCDEIKAMLDGLNVELLRIKVTEKSISVLVTETQKAILDVVMVRKALCKIV